MTVPAEQMAARAAAWAESEPAVRAALVYGSLAQGTADGAQGTADPADVARIRERLASGEQIADSG